jgi:hypothetical protein
MPFDLQGAMREKPHFPRQTRSLGRIRVSNLTKTRVPTKSCDYYAPISSSGSSNARTGQESQCAHLGEPIQIRHTFGLPVPQSLI